MHIVNTTVIYFLKAVKSPYSTYHIHYLTTNQIVVEHNNFTKMFPQSGSSISSQFGVDKTPFV